MLFDLGCHTHGVYIECLVYADDIILLSPSVGSLQRMLDICYGIVVRKLIFFQRKEAFSVCCRQMSQSNDTISWSNRLKYLGVYFKSGHTLLINNEMTMRKFYAAANAIYTHVKFASEVTVLFLMESFCLPLLTWAYAS